MCSPQASLPSAVRKIVNVLCARAQKLEEINILTFARLADAQQDQEIAKSFFGRRPLDHTPNRCKGLYCVLCIVVVPGYIIKIQEREHFVAILLQAANELLCRFAGDQEIGETIVETVHRTPMLSQEAFL